MSYKNDDIGFHYAFDGMYCNIDNISSQDEEDAREDRIRQLEFTREKLKLKLIKHFSKYSSHEMVLFQAKRYLTEKQINQLIARYLKKENLPSYYKVVVNQRDSLQLLVSQFFTRVVGTDLDYFEYSRLDELVVKLIENEDRETAYNRVSEIRKFVNDVIYNRPQNEQLKLPLSIVETKNLLSACRISLLLNDFLTKDDSYQLEVNEKTNKDYFYELSRPLEEAILPSGNKYIARWKARHLHTLEYYASVEMRNGIEQLEAVNTCTDIIAYTLALIEVCLVYK